MYCFCRYTVYSVVSCAHSLCSFSTIIFEIFAAIAVVVLGGEKVAEKKFAEVNECSGVGAI